MAVRLKSQQDIETLREGGRRLASVLEHMKASLKPGMTTKEIDSIAHDLITSNGDVPAFLNYQPEGSRIPFPGSVCVSVNEEIVHGVPSEERVIQEGDIVTVDLGLIHEDLITDSARTFTVGKVSEDAKKLLRATREALDAGIKVARPGNTTGDIGEAIERVALKYNVGIFRELVGHGVGYAVHEDPYVPNYGKSGEGEELVPGMVIAIEPMFSLGSETITLARDGYTYKTRDNSLSAHFEHTIAITETGNQILTQR